MRALAHLLLWRAGLVKAKTQAGPGDLDYLARRVEGNKSLVEFGVWSGAITCRLRAELPTVLTRPDHWALAPSISLAESWSRSITVRFDGYARAAVKPHAITCSHVNLVRIFYWMGEHTYQGHAMIRKLGVGLSLRAVCAK